MLSPSRSTRRILPCLLVVVALAQTVPAQSVYQVVSVPDGGTISGVIKWVGPLPHLVSFPISKDPQVCVPEKGGTRDLERLVIGPNGGVANTVVFLKDIAAG